MIHGLKKFGVQASACLAVTLGVLAWSGVAFCGEIHEAVAKGDVEKVKALLKADPSLIRSGVEGNSNVKEAIGLAGATPLHIAVKFGHMEIVQLLLASGADINAKDQVGATPLIAAVGYLHPWTSVDVALEPRRYDLGIIKLLVEKGAAVNAPDTCGTALGWAAYFDRKDAVEFLLKNRAKTEGVLFTTVKRAGKEVLELLLAQKLSTAPDPKFGISPLHVAAWSGNKAAVEVLLAHKADVNAKDNWGRTPLSEAKKHGNKDIVDLLLQHGAKE